MYACTRWERESAGVKCSSQLYYATEGVHMIRSLVIHAILIALASAAFAQDTGKWFDLKDLGPVTQRLVVTIENPADVPVEAALVHVPLKDLQRALPDAKERQLCVVDPSTKPARRDAADQAFVPFQISNGTLIFALALKPHETRQVFVYTAPEK